MLLLLMPGVPLLLALLRHIVNLLDGYLDMATRLLQEIHSAEQRNLPEARKKAAKKTPCVSRRCAYVGGVRHGLLALL
jgi:hypothetical protein